MALPYLDGSVAYGARTLVIPTTTGDTFVADSFEVTRPTNVIERTTELGAPSGFVVVAGFVTGTATLQLPTTTPATAPPALGEVFEVDAEEFVVTEVSQPETKDGLKTCNIAFRKTYN